jgi:hypothetical protein
MATRLEIERILREVGAVQHGVVARAQLLARGIPAQAIDRMVRTGRLAVLQRGVYQIGPLPVVHSAEVAAVLACARRPSQPRERGRIPRLVDSACPSSNGGQCASQSTTSH